MFDPKVLAEDIRTTFTKFHTDKFNLLVPIREDQSWENEDYDPNKDPMIVGGIEALRKALAALKKEILPTKGVEVKYGTEHDGRAVAIISVRLKAAGA